MADYPYMVKTGALKSFFEHIQSAGVPPKVSLKYLEASGFKSTNDRPVIKLLSFLGFLDSSAAPTDLWQNYRNRQQAPNVLASALRTAYADLFSMYPDAYRKDYEALSDFFRSKTTLGSRALKATVDTFKATCSMADFEAEAVEMPSSQQPVALSAQGATGAATGRTQAPVQTLTLNVNIQLQLPATEDEAVYDKLFAALRKHIL